MKHNMSVFPDGGCMLGWMEEEQRNGEAEAIEPPRGSTPSQRCQLLNRFEPEA